MVVAATGGEPRELVSEAPGRRGSDTLAWSPDGRHVYFGRQLRRRKGQSGWTRVAVTGGAPEDLNLEIGEELRFRPDGRRLAFTRLEGEGRKVQRGEIWVMDHFLPVARDAATAPGKR